MVMNAKENLLEDLRQLADLWQKQQAEYPRHWGALASAAVRACSKELMEIVQKHEEK